MIKLLKEGAHKRENIQSETCAAADIEALRRQLRKLRRWQENITQFNIDDVRDLELIVSAIDKHIRRGCANYYQIKQNTFSYNDTQAIMLYFQAANSTNTLHSHKFLYTLYVV